MVGSEALLLLADGRLPAGGYAHSGGLESAIRQGRITTIDDLARFLTGRATTGGSVAAAFAAASCRAVERDDLSALDLLDAEFTARTPSPALRRVAQSLGRQLLRALRSIHPHPMHERMPERLAHPVAFGASAALLGLSAEEAARGILHETLMGPGMAVVKLMKVDPFQAHRAVAALIPLMDRIGTEAAALADSAPEDLPSDGAPLSDILAEHHEVQEVRLFAS